MVTPRRSGRLAAAKRVVLAVAVWLLLFAPARAGARAVLAEPTAPGVSSTAGPDLAPGRVVVKFRDAAAPIPDRTAQATYGALAIEVLPLLGAQRWRVAPGSEDGVARRLAALPSVEYAEPDRILRLSATPNDPLYTTHQWNLPKINAPAAWDITIGDPAVVVAVVDSGFDVLHPDGPAHIRLGCDYVRWRLASYGGACPPVGDDQNGHGTHVAGIVAAGQNNALGVTGLAPGVTLLVIRTADAAGSSYMSDVAQAIREAADGGARVVNLSLGGTTPSTTLRRAVDDAVARGLVIVAAAGNEYQTGNPVEYPAAYPGVLAVGAVTADDGHASYSNTGAYVGLVAPVGDGGGAMPTSAITSLYPLTGGAYAMMVGTSQAAPQVAAAAGLVLSVRPTLGGVKVVDLLRSTAHPLGGTAPNPTFGYGRLDVRLALAAAMAGIAPAAAPSLSFHLFLPVAARAAGQL